MSDRVRPEKRTLLIRPGAIGDFLLSLPALETLQTDYTEVWCSTPNIPLAQFANSVFSIASTGLDRLGFLPTPGLFERLEQFHCIHSWYGTNRPEFRSAVASLPFRFYDALPPNNGWHALDFYCAQVGATPRLPTLRVCPDSRPLSRQGFVLHPFASSPAKRWPLEHFRELGRMLQNVQFCSGPEDNLPGSICIENLGDLAQWLAEAEAFVGNDSGITHLAAAVGTPVVALFGPSDPNVWRPIGPAVRVLHRQPLTEIQPQEVYNALLELRSTFHAPADILL